MKARLTLPVALALVAASTSAATAQTSSESAPAGHYEVDPAHAGVNFKISHLGLSWVSGRFDTFSGDFTLDPDPSKVSVRLTIQADSLDTNSPPRDGHLKSPDFFDAKQFPTITFKSTSLRAIPGGYAVAGDLTMHGETKSISFNLLGGRSAEFPKGTRRTGFSTDLVLKRTDFGVGKPNPALGDDVHVAISFEGVAK